MTLMTHRAQPPRANKLGVSAIYPARAIRAFVEGEGVGPRLKALLFRARDGVLADMLLSGKGMALHFAGHLRAEEWNGVTNPGFVITDMAAA